MSDTRTPLDWRIGAIEFGALAEWANGSSIHVRVGDMDVNVTATPKGRRAYLTVTAAGRTRVLLSAYIDDRWWHPADDTR